MILNTQIPVLNVRLKDFWYKKKYESKIYIEICKVDLSNILYNFDSNIIKTHQNLADIILIINTVQNKKKIKYISQESHIFELYKILV